MEHICMQEWTTLHPSYGIAFPNPYWGKERRKDGRGERREGKEREGVGSQGGRRDRNTGGERRRDDARMAKRRDGKWASGEKTGKLWTQHLFDFSSSALFICLVMVLSSICWIMKFSTDRTYSIVQFVYCWFPGPARAIIPWPFIGFRQSGRPTMQTS